MRAGRKVYSQTDEDGIIAEIFRRIGPAGKTFIEIGVESGIECNTLWLLIQGWRGAWIEADDASVNKIRVSHAHWIDKQQLRLLHSRVTAENINALLFESKLPEEVDFLSIDIDSNDYWVWKAIDRSRPRVICIEYNATWPPPVALTIKYNPSSAWSRTNYFGASLSALSSLGEEKGYSLVGCNLAGANAFFVRKDLVGDMFWKPGDVGAHYEPARYFLGALPSGHPGGVGETIITRSSPTARS